jgi:hypothetical protein
MKRLPMALGTLAVTFANVGCAPTVLDPIHQGTGGGGTVGTQAGGTTMLAMLFKDVPPTPNPSNPEAAQLPSTPDDPDALILIFSNVAVTCASPAITCDGELGWETMFAVPSDLVRVGTIDLANPRVSTTKWTFLGDGMGMCGGGGGAGGPSPVGASLSGWGNTLQITSTDSGSISVELSGGVLGGLSGSSNDMTFDAVHLDGSYTASRCEPAPATPPPNAAVAILGSKLPAGLPANPTIGTTPDPTALYVFLGTGTQTCADPLSDLGCSGAGRMVLKIPAALQQPGTLQLSDPQLAASAELTWSMGNCTARPMDSFVPGTLTISSADTTGLTFTLFQSAVETSSPPLFDADGLYQATICP